MIKSKHQNRKFYGTTTIGEKGQVVIPIEARKSLKLKKGDKMLVFGIGDMFALARLSQIEVFAKHLENRLEHIKKILKHNRK